VNNILLRDVPDDVLAIIDSRAKRLGISRAEYLRRTLERERGVGGGRVTAEHLQRAAELSQDLDDQDVMSGAWA
jgi:hypothetical protein